MNNKTVIQHLIDWTYQMEGSIASIIYTETDIRLIKQLREKFEGLLEEEKKQMELAVTECYKKHVIECHRNYDRISEGYGKRLFNDFFNSTYQNK